MNPLELIQYIIDLAQDTAYYEALKLAFVVMGFIAVLALTYGICTRMGLTAVVVKACTDIAKHYAGQKYPPEIEERIDRFWPYFEIVMAACFAVLSLLMILMGVIIVIFWIAGGFSKAPWWTAPFIIIYMVFFGDSMRWSLQKCFWAHHNLKARRDR